ncbi:MAG: hypothetical protein SOZ59_05940 [Candidatus Limivivens sp.]|nr:hypothetical protein [Candidatus Limivivens sp.]
MSQKKNRYDDGNIPEIDLPKPTDGISHIPEEMPESGKTIPEQIQEPDRQEARYD